MRQGPWVHLSLLLQWIPVASPLYEVDWGILLYRKFLLKVRSKVRVGGVKNRFRFTEAKDCGFLEDGCECDTDMLPVDIVNDGYFT